MEGKVKVTLPLDRETKGTVVYAVKDLKSLPVGQVYINKEHLGKIDGEWPTSITLTIEPGDATR
jgi:hypothetical protein